MGKPKGQGGTTVWISQEKTAACMRLLKREPTWETMGKIVNEALRRFFKNLPYNMKPPEEVNHT